MGMFKRDTAIQQYRLALTSVQCYLLCRYLCLAAICSILVGFNVTTEVMSATLVIVCLD